MWKPDVVGEVVAERTCELRRGNRIAGRLTIRFGRPVRNHIDPNDPWWCPFVITIGRQSIFKAVAGQDSLQSLILALRLATDLIPAEAEHHNATANWLGETERIIFAREAISTGFDNAVLALRARLKQAAAFLDDGKSDTANPRRQAVRALAALAGAPLKPRKIKAPAKRAKRSRP